MDFMMHHSEHGGSPPSSNLDHAARSACPALRAAAEQNQHPPMFSARPNYHIDPVHSNPHFWHNLPPPYSRWTPEPAYQPNSSVMPPSSGHVPQPTFPSNTANMYNPQPPAFRYRTPMLSLQRIGGTAPIQHSQGNFSGSNQGQPHGGTGGVTGPGAGAHGSRTNNTLPSLNPIPPASAAHNLQTQTYTHSSRPAQQPGRQSPPSFLRQNSMPSTSLSMAEVTVSSSGGRNEAGPSQLASSSPPRRAPTATRNAEMSSDAHGSEPRRSSANRNRRGLTRLPSSESGWSSDDDSDPDAVALSLLEAAVSGTPGDHGPEEHLRAHQIMRGAVSSKRVASKKAITSLESVTISSLPENERTCVICYNDYGVETPEGNSENPLRLPKCKHVFGDHCIKKWFEESDSCPYCRDKVPSEPQYRQTMNAHNVYRFLRQHSHNVHFPIRAGRDPERGGPDSLSRPSEGMLGGFAALASSPYADLEYGGIGGPAFRRADGTSLHASRTPAWHGNSGERHSPLPFSEVSENRRRVRPRHGSLRGLPPGRQHFAASPANGTPQNQVRPALIPSLGSVRALLTSSPQQYPWISRPNPGHSHNRQHSASGPTGRPAYDTNIPTFPFQSQLGVPSEPYLNPLNITSPTGTTDEYPLPHMRAQHVPPMSPTYPGPEVYMTNAEDTMYGGPISHQQL
ncbi:hypothetical protein F5Y13DRAFT_190522 [Hypoxylon sp. FL1857]|nr:hypothetical protein F5Y13DRAFT_190522 [Hypoxylon sp. FL1857]